MLKRIRVDQLRVGMFLHELCGSWLEHPFWRSAFLINSAKDLDRIRKSGISEVWIDTSKGGDVEAGEEAVDKETADEAVDRELDSVATPMISLERCSMAEEMQRAQRICGKSKEVVASLFTEARMGKALDTADAMPLVEEIAGSVMRNPGTLISLARLKTRDDYTYMHSVAVCALMCRWRGSSGSMRSRRAKPAWPACCMT